MTDRLDLAHAIEAAGIERKAAEHLAATIFDAIRENVATKQDIAELSHRIDLVERRIDLVEHRLLTRLGGLIVVGFTLLFAALHFWPPHG
jgi:uncharacterized protein Yka (UPF0111/DUF47 family)